MIIVSTSFSKSLVFKMFALQPAFSVLPASWSARERDDKKRDVDIGKEDADRGIFPSFVVFVSSGDNPDKGLQNIGSMFLQSNSLGTGMDKLDGDKDLLPPRQKPARSVGGIIPLLPSLQ